MTSVECTARLVRWIALIAMLFYTLAQKKLLLINTTVTDEKDYSYIA